MLRVNVKVNVGYEQHDVFQALIKYMVPNSQGYKTRTDWLAFSNGVRATLSCCSNSAPSGPYPCFFITAETTSDKIDVRQVIEDGVERLRMYGLKEAKAVRSNDCVVEYVSA